jgi:hypothetical protein
MEEDMNDELRPIREADVREGGTFPATDDPSKTGLWAELLERAAELPERLRKTFDLVFSQGLPETKVAAILGVPIRTVRRRCQSALLALLGRHGDTNHPEQAWEALNQRRVDLIEKESNAGLSQDEQTELEKIQEVTGKYLNIIAPLPFDRLEQVEEQARRAGIRLGQEEP